MVTLPLPNAATESTQAAAAPDSGISLRLYDSTDGAPGTVTEFKLVNGILRPVIP